MTTYLWPTGKVSTSMPKSTYLRHITQNNNSNNNNNIYIYLYYQNIYL